MNEFGMIITMVVLIGFYTFILGFIMGFLSRGCVYDKQRVD